MSDVKIIDTEYDLVEIRQTANFEVWLHAPEREGGRYGSFKRNVLGAEHIGGLWFERNVLVDYEGVEGYLPNEILDLLESIGFDVEDMKPREGF